MMGKLSFFWDPMSNQFDYYMTLLFIDNSWLKSLTFLAKGYQ